MTNYLLIAKIQFFNEKMCFLDTLMLKNERFHEFCQTFSGRKTPIQYEQRNTKNPSKLSLITQAVVRTRDGPLRCHEFCHTFLGI